MKSKHIYFITGLLAATIGVAGFFSIDQIHAANNRLEREIKFARRIGIYDSTSYSNRMLNRPLTEAAFYRGLSSVLHELGLVTTTSPAEIRRVGIMPAVDDQKVISRKASCEGIFRAISHGLDSGKITTSASTQTFQPFYDWIIEEKYMQGLNIAVEKGIIKGMPNGRFCPNAQLKTKDALVLFRRLYDALATQEKASPVREAVEPAQEDATLSVGGMSLERLQKAGAFSLLKKNLDLQNNQRLRLEDLSTMLHGLLHKANKPAYITEVKYLTRKLNPRKFVSRKTFAYLSSTLVRALPTLQVDNQVLYADVSPNSGLARALSFLSRADIRLGYENNLLKGNEFVSTIEVLGVLDKILENSEQMQIDTGAAATRNDFERFKALIETRKARIRRILNRH